MDKLFRLPTPVSYRAKDGSGKKVLEHRLGRSVIAFTKKQLLNKVGLEKIWRDMAKGLQRKITNIKEFNSLSDSLYATQMKRLGSMVNGYRRFLTTFYETQDLLPCFTYVPIDGSGEFGVYIQALVDKKTSMLVAGEPDDLALWSEVTASREKSHVAMYDHAIMIAKGLMKLPSVNRDIMHRMTMVSKGQVPNSPFLLGQKQEEK